MGYLPNVDKKTKALITIDYPHHEIHEGNHFYYTDCLELGSGATQDYLLTTPNSTKHSHLSFSFSGSAITALDLYEGSNKTGTTLQTILNNNRNSTTTSENILHKAATGASDGTKIWCHKAGSATNQAIAGVSSSQDSEIVLKANTKYLFRITSGTAANLVNLLLNWYEHQSL